MKLSDKAFYQRKAEQAQPEVRPNTGELFDILAQQFQAPAGPNAQDPMVPVTDKIQQYKDVGLDDKQIEEVMKMGAPEDEPPRGPEDALPMGEYDDAPAPKPEMPPQLPDLQLQQPPLEPAQPDVKDLMENKSPEEKKAIILSFLAHVQKIQNEWNEVYSQLSETVGPSIHMQWRDAWGDFKQLEQYANDPDMQQRRAPVFAQAKATIDKLKAKQYSGPEESLALKQQALELLNKLGFSARMQRNDRAFDGMSLIMGMGTKAIMQQPDLTTNNIVKVRQEMVPGMQDLREKSTMNPQAQKKKLWTKLKGLQGKISHAGSIYKKLFRLMQPSPAKPEVGTPGTPGYKPARPAQPGIPENEALQWLKQQVQNMQGRPSPLTQPPEEAPPEVPEGTPVKRVDNPKFKPPQKKSSDDGNQPAGTKNPGMNGQRDTLSSPELPGTGKFGQMAPGQPDPGGPPTPTAPPMGDGEGVAEDPGLVEEQEDPRPLEEIMMEMKDNLDALIEKIQSGSTMEEDGTELEPVTTDSGAMPAPAPQVAAGPGGLEAAPAPKPNLREVLIDDSHRYGPGQVQNPGAQPKKQPSLQQQNQIMNPNRVQDYADFMPPGKWGSEHEAVDNDAKEYYHDYYGEYGDAMTKDRVAEIVDLIDETAQDYGVVLTTAQTTRLARMVEQSTSDHPLSAILDRNFISYMINTKIAFQAILPDDEIASRVLRSAANGTLAPELRAKVAEYQKLADSKMKKPKINEQQPDSVKLEDHKDKADEGDHMLARPAHLMMEVDEKWVDGAYLKLMLKWDADAEAADRSDDGMKHAVLSFVKGLESTKEFVDYGFLGQPWVEELDVEAGTALVSVRTQKPGDAPTHVETSSHS